MRYTNLSVGCAVIACLASGEAKAGYCDEGNTVKFGKLGWESADLVMEIVATIFKDGYGCKIDIVPGATYALETAMASDEIQILSEEWIGRSSVWDKFLTAGSVANIGHPFVGAQDGWFIPRYLIEGDHATGQAAAPDLKSVLQLSESKYIALFSDPEAPGKGRFLNSPTGWPSEAINTAKLEGYGLADAYNNFRPGGSAALEAAISAAYQQREPFLAYYWTPAVLMGRFDLVKLEEPAYSSECWNKLSDSGIKHDVACDYPETEIVYGVSSVFKEKAPELIEVLKRASIPLQHLNRTLGHLAENGDDLNSTAQWFLRENRSLWADWVNEDAKVGVEEAIRQ